MTKKNLLLGLALVTGLSACQQKAQESKNDSSYKTPETKLASDVMTPEVLWSFGRLGGESISPDEKTVLYGVTYFNKEEDKSYRDLYTLPVAGGKATQITNTKAKEWGETWTKDGKIAFMSAESGSAQIWMMDADGSNRKQVSNIEGGINEFKFSPDGTKIVYSKEVKLRKDVHDKHPDLKKTNGRVITDEFYRHWDHWVETYTHLFVADFNANNMLTDGKDIMKGEQWEAPVRPWGGMEQVGWTVDGKTLLTLHVRNTVLNMHFLPIRIFISTMWKAVKPRT